MCWFGSLGRLRALSCVSHCPGLLLPLLTSFCRELQAHTVQSAQIPEKERGLLFPRFQRNVGDGEDLTTFYHTPAPESQVTKRGIVSPPAWNMHITLSPGPVAQNPDRQPSRTMWNWGSSFLTRRLCSLQRRNRILGARKSAPRYLMAGKRAYERPLANRHTRSYIEEAELGPGCI